MNVLNASLNWRRALPGGDFELRAALRAARGVTALYGRSGAGKTTLLRCLAGLERPRPDPGHVALGDTVWQDARRFWPAHQRRVGFVFQEPRLFPHLSVAGNLDYARRRAPGGAGQVDPALIDQLDLQPLLARRADTLSGGQQRRAAIARALLSEPALLLLDEPLSGLDGDAASGIMRYLRELFARLPMPVIYVSHHLSEIAQLADRIAVLERGSLVAEGPVADMLTRLEQPLALAADGVSLLRAELAEHDPAYHLSGARLGDGLTVFLPLCDRPIGESLRIQVPAKDVSVSRDRPGRTSVLNVWPARFDSARRLADGHAVARLALAADGGEQHLLARITQKSLDRLELSAGDTVYAQIKTVALAR